MNKIDFTKLYKPFIVIAAALFVAGIAVLLIFSGGTTAGYTLENLGFLFFVKVLVAAVLVCGLGLVYLAIRFRKSNGVRIGLCAGLSAAVSAIVAFSLCVVLRAPLNDYAFAVILLGVCVSYVASLVFFSRLGRKTSRKGVEVIDSDIFNRTAQKAFKRLKVLLLIAGLILVAAFILALVFGASVLALYAFPAILTMCFAVVFTLSVGCRLYIK